MILEHVRKLSIFILLAACDQSGTIDPAKPGIEVFDRHKPEVYLSTSVLHHSNILPIPFQVRFSENVTNFTRSDVVLSGGRLLTFEGQGLLFNFEVEPDSAEELVVVQIKEQAVYDESRNFNRSSLTIAIQHDRVAPDPPEIGIAGGAGTTGSMQVTLSFSVNDATRLYVTNTPGCQEGGDWQNFVAFRQWDLSQADAVNTVFAKVADEAGNESGCNSAQIVHAST